MFRNIIPIRNSFRMSQPFTKDVCFDKYHHDLHRKFEVYGREETSGPLYLHSTGLVRPQRPSLGGLRDVRMTSLGHSNGYITVTAGGALGHVTSNLITDTDDKWTSRQWG